jgi:hypothetical protein
MGESSLVPVPMIAVSANKVPPFATPLTSYREKPIFRLLSCGTSVWQGNLVKSALLETLLAGYDNHLAQSVECTINLDAGRDERVKAP